MSPDLRDGATADPGRPTLAEFHAACQRALIRQVRPARATARTIDECTRRAWAA